MANAEWEKVYQIKGLPVKFVWRGSPYNDLKATVEGGNRDYVAVARIVASSPISQAEAEKLAGDKWRQIKKTARNANSRAANAKFKVGDKVKSSGMRGVFVVKRVMRAGDFSFDSNLKAEAEKAYANGDVGYEVYDEDDSDEVTYLFEKDDRLTLANSAVRSRNAVVQEAMNARWRIIYKNLSGPLFPYGKETYSTREEAEKRAEELRKRGREWRTNASYFVDKVGNSIRSRNAVVQKALNARRVARNFTQNSEFEVGDVVRFRDSVRSVPHDETYTVVKVSGNNVTIKGGRENGTSTEFADRLEIVENADTSVLRETAVNGAGYVDASTVVIRPGDAVVFKTGYRSHSNDDDWLERNGDTVREVRGDEVKIGPSANDWAKIKDLMVWHNSRSTNAVVAKALNAARATNASACNGRDAAGLLTVGTKVRFGNGKTGEIVKVKRIYSHGFVEPEYTVRDADGRTFIENEGRFETIG